MHFDGNNHTVVTGYHRVEVPSIIASQALVVNIWKNAATRFLHVDLQANLAVSGTSQCRCKQPQSRSFINSVPLFLESKLNGTRTV